VTRTGRLEVTRTGRLEVTRTGRLEVTETVPCSTPVGPCPGTVGSVVVLRGDTVFDVLVHAVDPAVTPKVLETFEIPRH
jgi:hypothetical protein